MIVQSDVANEWKLMAVTAWSGGLVLSLAAATGRTTEEVTQALAASAEHFMAARKVVSTSEPHERPPEAPQS